MKRASLILGILIICVLTPGCVAYKVKGYPFDHALLPIGWSPDLPKIRDAEIDWGWTAAHNLNTIIGLPPLLAFEALLLQKSMCEDLDYEEETPTDKAGQ